MADLGDLRQRLANISEELGDAIIDVLREAIEAGEAKPPAEKKLLAARRAVDKALRSVEDL